MNTVVNASTPTEFPSIDFKLLAAARERSNKAMVDITLLEQKVQRHADLKALSQACDEHINKAHFALPGILQEVFLDLEKSVKRLEAYLAQYPGSDTGRQNSIISSISRLMSSALEGSKSKEGEWNGHLARVSKPIRSETLSAVSGQIDADLLEAAKELEKFSEQKSALEKEEKTLEDAISGLETTDYVDIGKETALNLESLSKLKAAPPEVLAVEQGLKLLEEGLDKAKGTLNYLSLVEGRQKAASKVATTRKKIDDKDKEVARLKLQSKMVEHVSSLESHRQAYAEEAEKVAVALSAFYRAHGGDAFTVDQVRQFVVEAQAFIAYLKAIR